MPKKSDSSLPTRSDLLSPKRHGNNRRHRRGGWILKVVLVLFVLGLVAGLAGGAVAYFYAKPRQELAETFDLAEIDDLEIASLILDRHGEEIGRIFVQNRQPISYEEVSPNMIKALMAAEDSRFFVHNGVDYVGILRAMWLNFKAGEVTQGASTITQQLARNAFNLKGKTISRKVTEAFLARRIERELDDKEKIMEMYLNRVYFGSGFYGVSAAAKGYFDKESKDLTIPESAMLAGVVRNPKWRSPYNYPEAALKTRNYVMQRMYKEDMLDRDELKIHQAEPLGTVKRTSAFGESKYVYERVRQRVIQLIGYERASEGGFVIHTTIDNGVQQAAEASLTTQLNKVETHAGYPHQTLDVYQAIKKNFLETAAEGASPPLPDYLQGAALMIDNHSGGIIALVGGRDFNDSMFDRTTQARRPPGTAFTPFVFAAAFESGLYPGTLLEDSPMDNKQVQIGGESGILGEWGTESEAVYEGEITARRALATSRNAATVRIGTKTGLDKVVALATKAGIRFFGDTQQFNATLLGKSETSMEELCLAYTIFPNQGIHPREIHVIGRIDTIDGEEIYSPKPQNSPQPAVDAYTAYQVSSCLSDALEYGTGRKARDRDGLGDYPVAGKSGTEYGFTDNWFAGYTSEVTCVVWAGFDKPRTIFPGAFSSDTVLPVWTAMMNKATETFEPVDFVAPRDAVKVEICRVSGQLATDACYEVEQDGDSTLQVRSTYVEYLRPGTEVTEVCEVHGGPGAVPRTGPSRSPDRGLTLEDEGGALRALPMVDDSDPIVPVGRTVVGLDPYQSLAPVLRAQIVVPAEPVVAKPLILEDGSDGFSPLVPGEKLRAIPRPDGSGANDEEGWVSPSGVSITRTGSGEESDGGGLTAIPVARPFTVEPRDAPPNRVTLPPPRPIEFD